MPLKAGYRDKFAGLMVFAHHCQDFGPAFFGYLEAIEPFLLDIVLVLAYIVPVAVGREAEEVKMVPGNLKRPFERSASISDLAVVVEVAEVDVIAGGLCGI